MSQLDLKKCIVTSVVLRKPREAALFWQEPHCDIAIATVASNPMFNISTYKNKSLKMEKEIIMTIIKNPLKCFSFFFKNFFCPATGQQHRVTAIAI
jgi:hypothetical protein